MIMKYYKKFFFVKVKCFVNVPTINPFEDSLLWSTEKIYHYV